MSVKQRNFSTCQTSSQSSHVNNWNDHFPVDLTPHGFSLFNFILEHLSIRKPEIISQEYNIIYVKIDKALKAESSMTEADNI